MTSEKVANKGSSEIPRRDSVEKSNMVQDATIEDATDNGAAPAALAGFTFEEETEAEKKLVRKVDCYILPTIWICYMLSYMDRSNVGNARVAGMGDDLELDDDRYYLVVVLFTIGYVIAEVPSNMILAKTRPSLYISVLMILWGTSCAVIAAAQTWQQLVGLRFLLGVTEAGFGPAIMFLISSWYRKHEQSKRYVIYHSAGIASGAFGGILAGAITRGMDGALGLAGWRWLFIIEGVITIVAAFIVPFTLLDFPLTTKKLTPEERQLAYARLRADGITSRNDSAEHHLSHWAALKGAIWNWRIVPITTGYMIVIGCMALAYFYPIFAEQLGYNKTDAQYMTAPIYGTALVIAFILCTLADKVPNYRAFFVCGVLGVFGVLCSALASRIYGTTARYILLCFMNTAVWAGNPLSLSYSSMVLGPVEPEIRAICLAFMNGMANLAQLYGTYILTVSEAPKHVMGFSVYAGLFAIGVLIYLGSHFLYQKFPYKTRDVY